MPLEVRPIEPAQLRPWLVAVETAFGDDVTDETFERFSAILDHERVLAAFDGAAIVGGGAAFTFELTVPGGRLKAGGVTAVGMLPTHRRRGLLRQMMVRQLADIRAAGEPLAVLWASEGNIYQRFGYGLASLNGSIEIARERAVFRTPADWSGAVRLVDADTAAATFPAVYAHVADQTPGFYQRTDTWWRKRMLADPESWRRGMSRKFYALLERDGRPAAYAMYRVKDEWDEIGSKSVLHVVEAMSLDPAATSDIWRYLFGVDLMARISGRLGPVDHPLLLMLDEPRRLSMRVTDGLWLRIVDVAPALAGRSYAADGELVIELTDALLPDCAGRWRIVASGGRADVGRTDRPADLRLDTTDLAALYLGAFGVTQLLRAGRGEELVAGAAARADSLFATSTSPWCPEIF